LYYLGFLLLLTPLPAALTLDEVPNVHRSALLGIFILFLLGYALLRIQATKYGKQIILLGFMPLVCFEFFYFTHQYFGQSPAAEAYARYDSRTILIKRLITLESSYEAIIVPREIFSIYYLFYTHNYSPALAGTFGKNLYTPAVGKLKFVDSDCPSTANLEIKPNSLLVDLSRCDDNPQFQLKERVRNPDGTENYDLMTLLPPQKNAPKKLQTP
jgi:hypothetical protein